MIFSNVHLSEDTSLEDLHKTIMERVPEAAGVGYSYVKRELLIELPDQFIEQKDDIARIIKELYPSAVLKEIFLLNE